MKIVKYIEKSLEHVRRFMQALPRRKQYIEFFTAILSLPIMITAIILNINALRPKTTTPASTPAPSEKIIIISTPGQTVLKTNPVTSTPTGGACMTALPSVSISDPGEGDTVSKDAVCVVPNIAQGNYCAIVWRYSINNTSWSDYDDKAFCLYNLPSGNVTLRFQIKSTVTGATQEIDRHFTYTPTVTPTPTTGTASSSAH
jgi:hypothetical protein